MTKRQANDSQRNAIYVLNNIYTLGENYLRKSQDIPQVSDK